MNRHSTAAAIQTGVVTSGFQSTGLTTASANYLCRENVQTNDLAVMFADGTIGYALPPTDPDAYIRPINLTADATNVASAITNVQATSGPASSQSDRQATFLPATGGFAVVSCASSSGFLYIYSSRGALTASVTFSFANPAYAYVNTLSNGNIVVAWTNGGGSAPGRFAVYDINCNPIVASTPIGTNNSVVYQLCALTAGGFAILVGANSLPTIVYNYSNAGALLATNTITAQFVASGTSNDQFTSCFISPTTTGFAVTTSTNNGASTGMQSLSIYTAAGALTTPRIDVNTVFNSLPLTTCLGLPNGNVAVMWNNNSQTGSLAVYTQAGVQVGGTSTFNSYSAHGRLLLLASGNIGILASNASSNLNSTQSPVSPTGATLPLTSVLTVTTTNGVTISLPATLSDGSIAVAAQGAYNTTAVSFYAVRMDANLNPLSSTVLESGVSAAGGQSAIIPVANVNVPATSALYTAIWNGASFTRFLSILTSVPRRSPLGVVSAAANAGTQALTQILGAAQTRLTFAPSVTFNAQSNAIIGQNMLLTGMLAILKGLY